MTDRALLPRVEREAVQAAIKEIISREGENQTKAAVRLGVSQQAVGKAANRAEVGPLVARKVLDYFKVDMLGLIVKFGPIPAAPSSSVSLRSATEDSSRYHRLPAVLAEARKDGVPAAFLDTWELRLDAHDQPSFNELWQKLQVDFSTWRRQQRGHDAVPGEGKPRDEF